MRDRFEVYWGRNRTLEVNIVRYNARPQYRSLQYSLPQYSKVANNIIQTILFATIFFATIPTRNIVHCNIVHCNIVRFNIVCYNAHPQPSSCNRHPHHHCHHHPTTRILQDQSFSFFSVTLGNQERYRSAGVKTTGKILVLLLFCFSPLLFCLQRLLKLCSLTGVEQWSEVHCNAIK